MNKNPYETLGVAKSASDADIKKAYHRLVMKYHPDKNPGDKAAEEKFKEINNAFDILKDPQKRAAFDQFGSAAFAGGNGASAGAGGFGQSPFGAGAGGGFNGNPFEGMNGGGFQFNMGAGMEEALREAMRSFGFGGDFTSGASPFGAGAGSRGFQENTPNHSGRDLLHDVQISLKEAFTGKTETIKFTVNTKCEKCGGHGTADGKEAPVCKTCGGSGTVRSRRGLFAMESVCPDCGGLGRKISKKCPVCEGLGVVQKRREIEVKIPAGVENGTRLRIRGAGEAGLLGAESGDLYVDVHVRPDEKFQREGNDLFMRAVVPFATLALGGEIEVQTIDDKKLSVKIPAGTQINERMRVRGHGMPVSRKPIVESLKPTNFGDLYIDIETEVPTRLTEKQKKALQEFSGAENKKKGWF